MEKCPIFAPLAVNLMGQELHVKKYMPRRAVRSRKKMFRQSSFLSGRPLLHRVHGEDDVLRRDVEPHAHARGAGAVCQEQPAGGQRRAQLVGLGGGHRAHAQEEQLLG